MHELIYEGISGHTVTLSDQKLAQMVVIVYKPGSKCHLRVSELKDKKLLCRFKAKSWAAALLWELSLFLAATDGVDR